jgi:hypothetical protein
MKPKLQGIINQGFQGEALIAAMTLTFAELLRERGGSDEPLLRATEVFTKLPSAARKQTWDATRRSRMWSPMPGEKVQPRCHPLADPRRHHKH